MLTARESCDAILDLLTLWLILAFHKLLFYTNFYQIYIWNIRVNLCQSLKFIYRRENAWMPFTSICCCPQHSMWVYGSVGSKDLYSPSYMETKICSLGKWHIFGLKANTSISYRNFLKLISAARQLRELNTEGCMEILEARSSKLNRHFDAWDP